MNTHTLFTSPLEFHQMDGHGPAVASVSVKVFRTSTELEHLLGDDEHAQIEFANCWWSTATLVGESFGFGVEQDGRSGGWLVFTLDGAQVTRDSIDTTGLDAIEGNASRALARRLERAAHAITDTLTDVSMLELARDVMECQEEAPASIVFEAAHFGGHAVARCTECSFVCVSWDCGHELEHDCDALICDGCGGPCDADDAITDGFVNLCGSFRGNGCADR
jgi:hypothetical protein